jgi:hypothetical protein
MAQLNTVIAKAITEQTFLTDWYWYVILLAVTFVGAAFGTFVSTYFRERGKNYATSVDMERITDQLRHTTLVTEETKAQIQKALWWSQESWKRKYDLYHDLILACEEIADALWEIHGDTNVMTAFNGALFKQPSTDEDAKRLLPNHKPLLEIEDHGLERIRSATIGAQLLLNERANEALATLRSVRTQAIYIANWSYRKRITVRMDGIIQCKERLLEAAKTDLNITTP